MQIAKTFPQATVISRFVAAQESSDRDLLDKIAGGDRLAMRTLYGRHNVRVYRFVLRLTGDESKAEDLVSEVFFDVWRQAGRFEGRSQVSTWILAIARYKAITAMRQRRDEALDTDYAEAIVDPADDAEQVLEKRDTSMRLQRCLQQLSAEHREIIDLVYYHEKSVEEAAEIVGVPCGTVKTRMFYARKRIADLLAQSEGAPQTRQ